MGYILNISKADQNKDGSIKIGWNDKPTYRHYFATASHSIHYTSSKAKQIVEELSQIYPKPIYKIDVSMEESTSTHVEFNEL
jgi:hypothetical protein